MTTKRTAIYVLVTIALLATVGFILQRQNVVEQSKDNTVASTSEEKITQLTFPNNTLDTSDWQTYRNEEFGFEVKYPKEWEVYLLKKGDLLGIVDKDDTGIRFTQNGTSIGTTIFFSDEPFYVVEQRKVEWAKEGNAIYEYIMVGEVKGLHVIKQKESIFGQDDYTFGSNRGTISFTNTQATQKHIFEKILLSFRSIKN